MTYPYCVWTTKRPLSGRGLGHVTKIRNFGTPYNFGTNRDICFEFGTDIDDRPLLRPDHKTTPKWAWPGSRDRILHSTTCKVDYTDVTQLKLQK